MNAQYWPANSAVTAIIPIAGNAPKLSKTTWSISQSLFNSSSMMLNTDDEVEYLFSLLEMKLKLKTRKFSKRKNYLPTISSDKNRC